VAAHPVAALICGRLRSAFARVDVHPSKAYCLLFHPVRALQLALLLERSTAVRTPARVVGCVKESIKKLVDEAGVKVIVVGTLAPADLTPRLYNNTEAQQAASQLVTAVNEGFKMVGLSQRPSVRMASLIWLGATICQD
jgi:hypothetical protein